MTTGTAGRAAGAWTLADGGAIIADADGPATLLVRTEDVLLLAVDLPLSSHAKRLAALPFAVEDRIADPLDAVHLALGARLGDRRYLVGVVRHAVMQDWVARADAAGIGDAAFVPDALALPRPDGDGWGVDLTDGRALVRSGDGTGFAVPAALLPAAWEAAGRPAAVAHGGALPEPIAGDGPAFPPPPLAERVADPPLDLRQGAYVRRRGPLPSTVRRLATILGLAIFAHIVIATGDTMMLRAVAERRADTTRALLAERAPGTTVGDDVATAAADLLPQPGGVDGFTPLLTRTSAALAPLSATIVVRSMAFESGRLVLDLESSEPGIAQRVGQALSAGGVAARVTAAPGGARIVAGGA